MNWLLIVGTGIASLVLWEGPSLTACQQAYAQRPHQDVERAYCADKNNPEDIHWFIRDHREVR
ncbi:MAG: hypothetical protein KGL35_24830 [Bradyrhizobium sp.]|nr:hypothetical protein [Bradyrhizobium sp.]